jgi:hypothetical protein
MASTSAFKLPGAIIRFRATSDFARFLNGQQGGSQEISSEMVLGLCFSPYRPLWTLPLAFAQALSHVEGEIR